MTREMTRTDSKINIIAFTGHGILFFFGLAFFDTSTVLPLFIQDMTGSLSLVGVAVAIRLFSTLFVQLFWGIAVTRSKNIPKSLVILFSISYAAPILVAAGLFLKLRSINIVMLLLAALAIQWLSDGLIVIGYYDLLGRTLLPATRGRILGTQQFAGGICAVFGAVAVKYILDRQSIPLETRYLLIFTCGGVLLYIGVLLFSFARDIPHRQTHHFQRPFAHIPQILRIVRQNKLFRAALVCQAALSIAMACSPYVLLFARDNFDLAAGRITILLNIQVIGSVFGGLLMVIAASRLPSLKIIRLFCLFVLLIGSAGLLALVSTFNAWPLLIIMAFAAGTGIASWAAFMTFFVEIAPAAEVPLYMAGNSLTMLPLAIIPYFAGLIAEKAGFISLLPLCLAFAAAAFLISVKITGKKVIHV